MTCRHRRLLLVPLALLVLGAPARPTRAQTSASYKLQEHDLNAGGQPRNGGFLSSTSYHIKLDAIGSPVARAGLSSASYRADASFVPVYRPPGEITGLVFTDKTHFKWIADPSVGAYEVYRDVLSSLPGTYGTCFASGLTATNATDTATPAPRSGFFYLVTARNRLREEGTKGSTSTGPRTNTAPCP
jgi:hypothetical protein